MNDKKEKQLEILFEVAKVITSSLDIKSTLESILKLLHKQLKMNRGTITLYDEDTESIKIEVAYGLREEEKKLGEYKIGEGITGKVVKTEIAEIIPDISLDKRFLDRTGARGDLKKKKIISFICVPVKIEDKVNGALSIDMFFSNKVKFEEDLRFLNIIASIIAQVIKFNQLVLKDKESLSDENIGLKNKLKETYKIENLIGNSNKMKEVFNLIERITDTDTTVIIYGESGTGKELVANALHYNSNRSNGPFIKINCSAVPETLLESELFGHEKGAFTGADKQKKGKFEIANNGTILLDEIGDIPKSIQVKLLRVIQFKEFERLGGNSVIKSNMRIIAATNKDLNEEVRKGNFREDLYYRINIFPINVPPLRERMGDMTMVADYFLDKYAVQNNKDIKRISTQAINLLTAYHWPGNVRELENCMERAVVLCDDNVIRSEHLPPTLQTATSTDTAFKGTMPERIVQLEKEMVIEKLITYHGHQGDVAKSLGITERILGYKIQKYNIDINLYKKKILKYKNLKP